MLGKSPERQQVTDRVFRLQHTAYQIERFWSALLEICHCLRDHRPAVRIVAPVEPDFGAVGRSVQQRAASQSLQPCRPFDIFEPPFDPAFARKAPADPAQRRYRRCSIGDLMTPRQSRQRQVEKPIRILIHKAPVFGVTGKVFTIDV